MFLVMYGHLKELTRDAVLPSGKWKSFASDIYGFLWVGGKSGLIRFDPRKPENGWKFFEATKDYKGGTVRALNMLQRWIDEGNLKNR